MFTTKLEVDKHVENCTKKITSEIEKSNRSYAFAKLYYNVGDYEKARHYVTAYLSVKPKSPDGNYLLGLILEKLGKKHAALEAFRTSLQLDPIQHSLILKVCELLTDTDADLDLAGAEYFYQLGQKVDHQNPAVYALKERLMLHKNQDPNDVAKLLLKELETRMTDVNLRVRLLKSFVAGGKISDAYRHAAQIEETHPSVFYDSLEWYETVSDILVRYRRDGLPGELTWRYWFLLMSVFDRVVSLNLDERNDNFKETAYYTNKLFLYDQYLKTASESVSDCSEKQLVNEFTSHYRGQLYFHLTTIAYKQANRNLLQRKDAVLMTLPLLFVAYHTQPVDTQALWFSHLPDAQRKLVSRWRREASFRCSQAGNMILAIARDRKSSIVDKTVQYSAGNWRDQLYKKIFVTRDHQIKMNGSYFVSSASDVPLGLPQRSDVLAHDEESLLLHPGSLHHYVWVGMRNRLADLRLLAFEGLQYSVKNLSNCGAGTLSLLDVHAFVACATLCAKERINSRRNNSLFEIEEPGLVPVSITPQLGTDAQVKFLIAAYRSYSNDPGAGQGETRVTITKGIEVIRCVGRHGLDVKLLIKLANIFAERSKKCTKQSEIEANDARAELYWKTALPLLEKIKNNQFVNYPTNRLFEYEAEPMSASDVSGSANRGKLFLGTMLMKRKEHEKALKIFGQLKDPYASYNQALIYKQLADDLTDKNKDDVTPEIKSQNAILLSRARDSFYLTLDRLREPSMDQNHPLNAVLGTEIENIEHLLSKSDADCLNRNECDGMSDENNSSPDSDQYLSIYNNSNTINSNTIHSFGTPKSAPKMHKSTPLRFSLLRQETRPSPERLDAQIRQLRASEDAAIGQVFEQTRQILEFVGEIKETVSGLSGTVESMSQRHDQRVDDLKRHFQAETLRITQMVQKIDKEVADLKKDVAAGKQSANDNLYMLDEEYAGDYGLGNNLNFNLYPNVNNRAQAALPPNFYPPAGLYPGLYSPMAPYGYPNLALPQGLPFAGDQQLPADLRNLAATLPPTSLPYQLPPHLPTGMLNAPPNLNVSLLTGQNLAQVTPSVNVFKDSRSPAPVAPSVPNVPKPAPVNVVITASDPLPTTKEAVSQPVLSVTIPAQHIRGSKPHNYQIPLSVSSMSAIVSTPSVLNQPPPVVTTQGLLTNVSAPVYSAVEPSKGKAFGAQADKSLDRSSNANDANKSNVSNTSLEEYDPCPDFKPIIPLPDEVPVTTGEENENVLFEGHAKLFRFVKETKEWKERGVGTIKILENPADGKARILMRRDQVLKICANHFITKDMNLNSNKNLHFWSAPDFADEQMSVEQLCVKFAKPELAEAFAAAFAKAKDNLGKVKTAPAPTENKTVLGGFKFVAPPTFKKVTEEKPVEVLFQKESKTASPFANFTFGNLSAPTKTFSDLTPKKDEEKTDRSTDNPDDFVPTAEFKPVVPLPDIVEVKTGEENAEVLFDCRAKLMRFDAEKKEWKERGLGNMKILKENNLVRLLMRREQVHKVCCNHQILKNMPFEFKKNSSTVLTWAAQDFSEDELKTETFAIRFKTEEQAKKFLKTVQDVQATLDDKDAKKAETREPAKAVSFGDAFKPAPGSWECKNCYVRNDAAKASCPACGSGRSGEAKPEPQPATPKFSFGNVAAKPAVSFAFGAAKPTESAKTENLWDKFKPEAGSWACEACYTSNAGGAIYCVCCEGPKDSTIPKKEPTLKGINLDTTEKFTFGIPQSSSAATTAETNASPYQFGLKTTVAPSFKFGSDAATAPSFAFNFKPAEENEPPKGDGFQFGSEKSHSFEFKARSPRRVSTGQGDEESDASYVEEESDNIYFKPVIPLPEKVDVKTGEEDEEVLYSHRAKLFRFANGEWKERGTGDIKILKNRVNQKLRVVMRREQVLKICLNHLLTEAVDYQPKDEKTWLFVAADYSEGEISHDRFCLRFKSAEIANEFKRAVTDALKDESNSSKPSEEIKEPESNNNEVIFVSETTVTPEEEAEAKKLSLPSKFFAYRRKPMCECDQCKKDDAYYSCQDSNSAKNVVEAKETSTPKTNVENLFQPPANASSLFQTPPSSFSFKTDSDEKSGVLKDMLSKPVFTSAFTQPQNSVFNTTTSGSSSESSPFWTPSSTSFSTSGNLFGSKFNFGSSSTTEKFSFTSASSQGIFGTNTTTTPPQCSSSLFGSSTTSTPSQNLFSGSGSIFSLGTPAAPATPSGIFANASEKLFGSGTSIFSDPKTSFSFGQAKPADPPKDSPIFGSATRSKTENLKENDEVVFKVTSDVSFSSLAKGNNNSFTAFKVKSDEKDNAFSFLGAGAPVFGSLSKARPESKANDSAADQETSEHEESTADETYDPHYEPIVELPDEIVVKTGEEDENAIYNERAKVYRYDNELKEWKERGVGQFKILHHPVNNTYRFLLRREQVHKVVLNQLITPDLDLQPMSTSDKAWIWAGYNYVEDEPVLEKLAVRFKSAELAQAFYQTVQSTLGSVVANRSDQAEQYGDYEDDNDDEYDENYDDDDDDERSIICSKSASLQEFINGQWVPVGNGEIQIYYDSEIFASKIQFTTDEGAIESNSLIGINTQMTIKGRECIWRTVECAQGVENYRWRDLKAVFETDNDAQIFHLTYQEGVGYAQEYNIVDDIPPNEQAAEDSN